MSRHKRPGGPPTSKDRYRSPSPNLPPHRVPTPGIEYTTPVARSPYPPASAPVDPLHAGVIPMQAMDQFISRLPPKGYVPWERKISVSGTDVTSVPLGSTREVQIDNVGTRTTRLIFSMIYTFYEAGLDPLDPNVLTAMQDNQNAYGRIPFNLLVNGIPLVDVTEVVFDPGITGRRTISGYTDLNSNLLATGNHPTALYCNENQTLTASFQHVATPGNIPTAIGVSLRGYAIPTRQFEKVMQAIRT